MKFCCDVMRLAKYIVQKCYQDGHPISNLQLQKILYFLQIMYGRSTEGKKLLFQDNFKALPYGPVIPDVYNKFSRYGGRVIEETFNEPAPCSQEVINFVDQAVSFLREKTPWELVKISQAEGSPWDLTYSKGSGHTAIISQNLIIDEIKRS